MKRALLCVGFFLSCNSGGASIPEDDAQLDGHGKDRPIALQRRELKGGSRLKAKWIKGEDGSEISAGFFDTKLNTDCAFEEAEDGKMRCLPTPMAAHYWPTLSGFSYPLYLYVDSSCTQRAAASSLCSPPLKYARFTDTCGSRTRVAPASEVSTTRVYFKTSLGTCSSGIDPSTYQLRVYSLGQTMAVNEFAQGEVTME